MLTPYKSYKFHGNSLISKVMVLLHFAFSYIFWLILNTNLPSEDEVRKGIYSESPQFRFNLASKCLTIFCLPLVLLERKKQKKPWIFPNFWKFVIVMPTFKSNFYVASVKITSLESIFQQNVLASTLKKVLEARFHGVKTEHL